MTTFSPIRLIGCGTEHVESCASFAFRLGKAHGLSPARLKEVMDLHIKHLMHESGCGYKGVHMIGALASFSRPGVGTRQFIHATEVLVGERRIRGAVLNPVVEGMPSGFHNLYQGPVRWCPDCFREDVECGGEPYLRLIWQIYPLKVCMRHWTLLESRCGYCKGAQDSAYRIEPLSKCRLCGASLYELRRSALESDLTPFAYDFQDLVCLISRGERLPWGRVHAALRSVVDKEFGGIAAFKKWEENVRSNANFTQYLNEPRNIPTMYRIVQFCHAARVPLMGVLLGEPYPVAQGLLFNDEASTEGMWLSARRVSGRDHESLRKKVMAVVSKHEPPLSLKGIAAEVGVSHGYIRHRWPALVEIAHKRKQLYLADERARGDRMADELVGIFFSERSSAGESLSIKAAVRTLMHSSGLSRRVIERAAKRYLSSVLL